MASSPNPSDHFRNGRFFNPGAPPPAGFGQFLRWVTSRKSGYWPKFVSARPGAKPSPRVPKDDLVVTFVNHATFLLQCDGCNFLTDPVWSDRVSPISFLGPRRHRDPGLRLDDLPPIDAILISHNHYDHFDVPTLRTLARRHQPAVFCPLGLEPLLRRCGFSEIYELDWWEKQSWKGMDLHCTPAQHFSSRSPFDRNRTLWCGWIFGAEERQIFFAGDTGFGQHFASIAALFPSLRLALLPIGAFEPEWFMGPIHMTPEQAVEAHRILGASTSIGTHYGTFSLADDSMAAPGERLEAALLRYLPRPDFHLLPEGEARRLPRNSQAPEAAPPGASPALAENPA